MEECCKKTASNAEMNQGDTITCRCGRVLDFLDVMDSVG